MIEWLGYVSSSSSMLLRFIGIFHIRIYTNFRLFKNIIAWSIIFL